LGDAEGLPRRLSETERLDWLRLIRSENVGPITFSQLLSRFGTAAAALKVLPDLARRGGRDKPIKICSTAQAEQEMSAIAAAGAKLVAKGEAEYPAALATIDDAPPVLTLKGHPHLTQSALFAIVGARNASALGIRFARQIAQELGKRDLVIVSGLARGIDRAAHEGALERGTIAVQAGGIDAIYPPENTDLYQKIADTGLLVAELAFGATPKPQHFPRRNRIVSGMSLGVLVVEAANRSGSLITARMALEQNREVFAVPGSPLDPRAFGPNDLIRQGATLVRNADDIIEGLSSAMRRPLAAPLLPGVIAPPTPPSEAELAMLRARVLEKLGPSPVAVDEIVRQIDGPAQAVLVVLLELELAGKLTRHPGHRVSCT
jgi:DNA processing protein